MSENPKAFPSPEKERVSLGWESQRGMDLEDYFAGQALMGLCTQIPDGLMMELAEGERGGRFIAGACKGIGSAMLKIREEYKS